MSVDRYFARFARAVRVTDGRAGDFDLLWRDGQPALNRPAPRVAPQVRVAVALEGVARPGQVLTVQPGDYSGHPLPETTRRLYRGDAEDVDFDGLEIAVTADDLGRDLRLVETAVNPVGSVESVAEIAVEVIAPEQLDLTAVAAEITTAQELPLALAVLTADGDQPLNWSLTNGAGHFALEDQGAGPVLTLLSMPETGRHEVLIRAANAAGSAEAGFALIVDAPPVVAPLAVTLTQAVLALGNDAELPVVLAELSADGTQPLDWQVTGGGAHVAIDETGGRTVLRLLSMPQAGRYDLAVSAKNEAGGAEAYFDLTVTETDVAPETVTLSEPSAWVMSDAALPVVLALVSADGTGPMVWSVEGAEGVDVDTDGEGAALRLTAMPAEGTHHVTIRAANEVGAASADFALTVTQAVAAPTAVTLSAASADVMSDAVLPLPLAVLTADGTAPHDWSIDGSAAFAIVPGVSGPELHLLSMPGGGAHHVTLRAANAAGAAGADFVLTVTEAVVTPLVSASHGKVSASRRNPDGSISFTLTETTGEVAKHSDYAIPAAVADAGHAVMLVTPDIKAAGDGVFTVSHPGLCVAPVDDPAVVLYHWLIGGFETGQTGETFSASPIQQLQQITLRIRVTNLTMERNRQAQDMMIDVQPEAVVPVPAMHFRAKEKDRLVWNPSFTQNPGKIMYFSRFQYLPDADDKELSGNIMVLGTKQIRIACYNTGVMRAEINVTTTSGALIPQHREISIAPGDLVDVIGTFGLPVSPADSRISVKHAIWVNGVLKADGGSAVANTTFGATVINSLMLGGQIAGGPNDGGVTHDQSRSAIWLDVAMAPAEAHRLFVRPDGSLANPAVARLTLGMPILDFHNGVNHGSLGAPVTGSDLT